MPVLKLCTLSVQGPYVNHLLFLVTAKQLTNSKCLIIVAGYQVFICMKEWLDVPPTQDLYLFTPEVLPYMVELLFLFLCL